MRAFDHDVTRAVLIAVETGDHFALADGGWTVLVNEVWAGHGD
jgi:hypothetical protein